MSVTMAQVSLYPPRQASIGPTIREVVRILRRHGLKARIVWRTTLFPRPWPRAQMHLPWGGFIGMALVPSPLVGTEETR